MTQTFKLGLDADVDLTPYAQDIADAGFSHVGRYLKNVTRGEIAALHSAGLGVWFIYETTAMRSLGGAAAGVQDGLRASTVATALGIPSGTCIFTTCDTDPSNSQVPTVVSYGAAFATACGGYAAGFYACGAVLAASKLVPWLSGAMGWNSSRVYGPTNAWAMWQGPDFGGRAVSWQGAQWPNLGFDYDPNLIAREDFGLWLPTTSGAPSTVSTTVTATTAPTAPPAPTQPSGAPLPTISVQNKADTLKQWQRMLGVTDDGLWGPQTEQAFADFFS